MGEQDTGPRSPWCEWSCCDEDSGILVVVLESLLRALGQAAHPTSVPASWSWHSSRHMLGASILRCPLPLLEK